jgi:phosphate transport system permease protein
MAVALPLGIMIAIYLSEYASPRARGILKPVLEVLAGIPTVVYGFFALGFMTPLLQSVFGRDTVEIFNVASAGIVIGILIVPLVSSMSEDALSAVPRALREAAYGMGATRLETAVRIVVPAALSGLAAAFIVAMSRAVGETMVVAIAAGAGPRNFNTWGEALGGLNFLNPFKAAETMTGHIVRISGGDLSYDTIDYDSIFAIALLLFVMTLLLNIISQWIVRRLPAGVLIMAAEPQPTRGAILKATPTAAFCSGASAPALSGMGYFCFRRSSACSCSSCWSWMWSTMPSATSRCRTASTPRRWCSTITSRR